MAVGSIGKRSLPEYSSISALMLNFNLNTNSISNFSDMLKKLQIYNENLMKETKSVSNTEASFQLNNDVQSVVKISDNQDQTVADEISQSSIAGMSLMNEKKVMLSESKISNETASEVNTIIVNENSQMSEVKISKVSSQTKEDKSDNEIKSNSKNEKVQSDKSETKKIETEASETDLLKSKIQNKLEKSRALKAILKNLDIDVQKLSESVAKMSSSDLKELSNLLAGLEKSDLAETDKKSISNNVNKILNKVSVESEVQRKAEVSSVNSDTKINVAEIKNSDEIEIKVEDKRTNNNLIKNSQATLNTDSKGKIESNLLLETAQNIEQQKQSIKSLYRTNEDNSKKSGSSNSVSKDEKKVSSDNNISKNFNIVADKQTSIAKNPDMLNTEKKSELSDIKVDVKLNSIKAETLFKANGSSDTANNSSNNSGNLLNNFNKGQNSSSAQVKEQTDTQQVFKQNMQTLKNLESFRELVKDAKMLLNDESTEMQMKLSPKELGTVDIKVSVSEEGKLAAIIVTSNQEAKTLIDNNIQDLKQNFIEQGLDIQSFQVSVRDRGSENSDRSNHSKNLSNLNRFKKNGIDSDTVINSFVEKLYDPSWYGGTVSFIA